MIANCNGQEQRTQGEPLSTYLHYNALQHVTSSRGCPICTHGGNVRRVVQVCDQGSHAPQALLAAVRVALVLVRHGHKLADNAGCICVNVVLQGRHGTAGKGRRRDPPPEMGSHLKCPCFLDPLFATLLQSLHCQYLKAAPPHSLTPSPPPLRTATRLAKKAFFVLFTQSTPTQGTVKSVGMVDTLMAAAGWAKLTAAAAAAAAAARTQIQRWAPSGGTPLSAQI